MDNPETQVSLADIRRIVEEFAAEEIELAKAELKPTVKHAGIGSGLFAGAGAFAFHALWMLIISMALLIGWAFKSWTDLSTWGSFTLGFIVAAVVSLIIMFILAKAGQMQMKQVKKPTATIAEAQATVKAIADVVTGGSAEQTISVSISQHEAAERPQGN